MKQFLIFILSVTIFKQASAQNTGIGTTTPHPSAKLDITSTTSGILIPRMTSAQRIAIGTPAQGLLVYDTDTNTFWFYNAAAWIDLSVSVPGGWSLTGNAGTDMATNFIGTTDNQPLRWRVNDIWAGEVHPETLDVFLGFRAGEHVTSVSGNNTGMGSYALNKNTAGRGNTGIGHGSLYSNTNGNQNTAVGMEALYSNIQGIDNTAFGYNSLFFNRASYNSAFGSASLSGNTTGSLNTAMGESALRFNTTAGSNTAVGTSALITQSYGNGGVQWVSNNVAVGTQALYSNQPTSTANGVSNTAVGTAAMRANTIGYDNTAVGAAALYSNISGRDNTAIGRQALFYNNEGGSNTATGYKALRENTNGNSNTANGFGSLQVNTTGSSNTAVGGYSLNSNTIGFKNTASGFFALSSNTTGAYNTAMGNDALGNSATGNNNTAVGNSALLNLAGGFQNIAIGFNSGVHPAAPDIFNTISIGNDGMLNGFQNQVILGNNSTLFIGGKVNWGVVSDARIKNTVTEDVKGLSFISRLRPVTYHISSKAMTAITGNEETPDFPGKYDGEKVKYTGFVAQEVEQAAKASDYDFSGIDAPRNRWGLYTIRYAEFVVPLVKAMQEQQKLIENKQMQIEDKQKQIDELKARLEKIETLMIK
ncbi:MAG: tail fiber domain-containing protein [Bacteroidota bacterium]